MASISLCHLLQELLLKIEFQYCFVKKKYKEMLVLIWWFSLSLIFCVIIFLGTHSVFQIIVYIVSDIKHMLQSTLKIWPPFPSLETGLLQTNPPAEKR